MFKYTFNKSLEPYFAVFLMQLWREVFIDNYYVLISKKEDAHRISVNPTLR